MKHAKHWLVTAVMLLCSLTASAHDFVRNGIYYNLPEDLDFADPVVEVTYMGTRGTDYRNEYAGHVVIPPTVTYWGTTYRVTSIGKDAFSGCYALKSVTIPGTVEIIRGNAFGDCTGLTSIRIPEGVKVIGDFAFSGCTGLKSITIPESVEEIGTFFGDVFEGCNSLTSVKCPARFEHLFPKVDHSVRVGDFKFLDGALVGYVGSSSNVILPKNFQGKKYAIGERACKDSKITSITIPEGVTSIGDWAFDGTPWYNNHPDGVVYAGKVLYKYKGTMPANTSIEVKEGTVSISPSAFSGCSSLTSITIPESVTSIGKNAFLGCSKLTLVKCPVRFRNLFPKVDFSVRVGDFKFLDGVLVGYVGSSSNVVLPKNFQGLEYSIGSDAFRNSAITSITIPASVTSIENNAFHDCTSLKEVIFEDGSKTLKLGSWYNSLGVSRGLFYDCPLVNVYLGRNLSYYGRSIPFFGQTKLTTMTISEGVTSIEKDAFWNCSSLTSITIPESVRSIGEGAFKYCSSLTSVKCPARFRNHFPNVDFSVRVGGFKFLDGVLVGYVGSSSDIVLPQDFQGEKYAIGDNAFKNSAITSITIPESVKSIGNHAFSDCKNLTSINIPEGVTNIGNYAFSGCSSLRKVSIHESWRSAIESSKEYLFSGCPKVRIRYVK